MNNFKHLYIDHNSPTQKAINKMNKLGGLSLIVTKKKNILVGILSGRDLRNAILNKNILNKSINKIYNKKPMFVYSEDVNSKLKYLNKAINKLRFIPMILKKSKKIVDVIDNEKLKSLQNLNLKKINADIVIMAGGKGKRLLPYTAVLPKPLLPINDKPVLKHILEKFINYGENKFFITLNYKSSLLSSYLKTLDIYKKNLNLIHETKPLGTVGGLINLKKKLKNNFFLTNCDTIINTDYNEIFNDHIKNKNDLTIVVAEKKITLPYGVCEYQNEKPNLIEKPNLKFKVNTGFYLVKKSCLEVLNKKKYLDFDDFFNLLKKNKKKINFFTINQNDWLDVGQKDSYHNNLNKKF